MIYQNLFKGTPETDGEFEEGVYRQNKERNNIFSFIDPNSTILSFIAPGRPLFDSSLIQFDPR